MPPTTRLFNALNGQELKKIILQQVESALDNDFHFRRHLTYPVVAFDWKLLVSAYPLNPPEFDVATEGDIVAAPEGETISKIAPEDLRTVELKGSSKIDAPDAAREASGQQIPSPTLVGRKGEQVVVERPFEPQPEKAKKGAVARAVEAVSETLRSRPREE